MKNLFITLALLNSCVKNIKNLNIYSKGVGHSINNVNFANEELIKGIKTEEISLIHKALKAGADINFKSTINGWRPLTLASSNGNKAIVQLLLSKKADVNTQNKDRSTALTWASIKGHTDIVRLLLDKGADVNIKSNNTFTVLMIASKGGYTDIVRLLLEKGADVNAKDYYGYTALIYASKNGHIEIVKMLIKAGANIDHKEELFGSAALLIASEEGHIEIVKLLAEKGADVNIKNKCSNTALTLVIKKIKIIENNISDRENEYIKIAHILIQGTKRQLEALNMNHNFNRNKRYTIVNKELDKSLKESIEYFDNLLNLPAEIFIKIIKDIN